jgi:sporulation-control protein spo0M
MDGMYEDALDLLEIMICRDPQRLEIYMRIH